MRPDVNNIRDQANIMKLVLHFLRVWANFIHSFLHFLSPSRNAAGRAVFPAISRP